MPGDLERGVARMHDVIILGTLLAFAMGASTMTLSMAKRRRL